MPGFCLVVLLPHTPLNVLMHPPIHVDCHIKVCLVSWPPNPSKKDGREDTPWYFSACLGRYAGDMLLGIFVRIRSVSGTRIPSGSGHIYFSLQTGCSYLLLGHFDT